MARNISMGHGTLLALASVWLSFPRTVHETTLPYAAGRVVVGTRLIGYLAETTIMPGHGRRPVELGP